MNRPFIIYCVTNTVNGKRYVGQTCRAVEVRWRDHVTAAKKGSGCRVLGAAIRKYGEASFVHEVLEIASGQKEADAFEAKWITAKQSRSPVGYNLAAGGSGNGSHHEDSKQLIGESSKTRWREMSPDQRLKSVQAFRSNPEKRLARVRETNTTAEFGKKVAAGQKKFWSQFSSEEKTRRVRHQMAGMSSEAKSERVRKAWGAMTPEAREARVRHQTAGIIAAKSNNPAHSKQMSEWQTAQAKLRTPEQRQAMALKAWETRRAKYGQDGVTRMKTSSEYSASTKKGWANMSPEARAERVRKVQEGRRRAREARTVKLVRINLLSAA